MKLDFRGPCASLLHLLSSLLCVSIFIPETTEPNGKKFTGILLWWTSSTLMNLVSIQNNTIWLPDPIMQFDWLSHKSSIVKKQLCGLKFI